MLYVIMQITVKDVKNNGPTLEISDDCTVKDLLDKVRETYEFSNCNYVVEGQSILESTLLKDLSEPVVRLTTIMKPIPEFKYNSAQIHKALKGHHYTLVYLLHSLALENPYILSYIATCPEMVCEYLTQKLSDPYFEITTKGSNNPYERAIEKYNSDLNTLIDELTETLEDEEDIVPPNAPSINHYIVDRDNVNRILHELNLPDSEFQRVKDIYLFMDRNYQITLQYIRNMT